MADTRTIEEFVEDKIGRSLKQGTVQRVHGNAVTVRVAGSAKLLRGIPVVGGADNIHVGDTVLLREADGRIFAEAFATKTGEKAIVYSGGEMVLGGTDHAAVTVGSSLADVILLTGQSMQLKAQSQNLVFAGPVSGSPAAPTFRALSIGDLGVMGGTPALTYTTANAEGSASTLVRTDASLAIFDATVPTDVSLEAAATGEAAFAARRDHGHELDQTIVPWWSGVHTWEANAKAQWRGPHQYIHSAANDELTIAAQDVLNIATPVLRFDKAAEIRTAVGNLEISPAGDLLINCTGQDVYPVETIDTDLGQWDHMWRTLYAAELYVETLVAQDVLATIGGRIMVAPTTFLTSDLGGQLIQNNSFETPGDGGGVALIQVPHATGRRALYQPDITGDAAGDPVDVFDKWVEDATGGNITRDATLPYDGTYSCHLEGTGGVPLVYMILTLTGGMKYGLRFWAKGDGTVNGRYAVWNDTESVYEIPSTVTGVTGTTWTLVEDDFTVTGEGNNHILLILRGPPGTTGDCWYDLVELYEIAVQTEHNPFAVNDYFVMKTAPGGMAQIEVFQVTAGPTGGGPFTYTVTRDLEGTGINSWYSGDACAGLGYAIGSGWIELTSTSTVLSHLGPTMMIYTRSATTNWDDVDPTVAIGNLESVLDYSTPVMGWAIADDLDVDPSSGGGVSAISADPTNGVRLWDVALKLYDGGNLRIELDPTATGAAYMMWMGPTESEPGLVVNGNGNVWLSSLAVSDFGMPFFNEAGGIYLLDCQKIVEVESAWHVHDSRGDIAILTGAIQQGQGHWANTRGVVIEQVGLNYCTNPSFVINTTGWSVLSGATITRHTAEFKYGGACAEVELDGDTNNSLVLIDTPAASFAQGDWVTVSGWAKGPAGSTCLVQATERNAAGGFLNFVFGGSITFTGVWMRFDTTGLLSQATTDHLQISFRENDEDVIFLLDAVQIEKTEAHHTSYIDGTRGQGYAWTGTAHDSTSTRATTQLNLDNHASLLSGNTAWAVTLRVQVPFDFDGGRPDGTLYFWELWESENDRALLAYSGSHTIQAFYRENSVNVFAEVTGTFSAGDFLLLGMNVDTAGDIELFVNGVLADSADLSGRANLTATQMNLGSRYNGVQVASGTYQDLAIYDRTLSAEEHGMIWAMNQALVDMDASVKPGIYILDGEFKLMSSSSGERIEIDETGMRGYDDSDVLQVGWYASGDDAGKILGGAGAVYIDTDGLSLVYGEDDTKEIKWMDGTTKRAYIYAFDSAFSTLLGATIETATSAQTPSVFLKAINTGSTHDAALYVRAGTIGEGVYAIVHGTERLRVEADHSRFNGPVLIGTATSDPSGSWLVDGALYYNTSTDKLRLRANSAWVSLN